MIVGFDLDGVLCDLYDQWLMCIAVKHNIPDILGQGQISMYHIEDTLNEQGHGLTRQDMWDTLDFTIRQTNVVRPYPEAKGLLASIKMMATPVIITARLEKYRECTRAWVDKWLGPYEVHHVPAPEKVHLAKSLGVGMFVEDKAETAVAMAQAGIKSLLIDRPWNQGVNGDTGVIRINKLREAVAIAGI